MSNVTFITSRSIVKDDVTYTISVYEQSDGFFAYWECENCGNQSEPVVPAESREDAMARCETLIGQHHSDRHQLAVNSP